jgi:hypothetical protein
MTRLRTIAGAGVFALAAVALPAAASATTPPEPTATAPTDPGAAARSARLEAACARVPNVQTRVDAAISLLQGDADTRGSLAWLNAQLGRAQSHDRTEVATVLQNRIDVRTARLALLQERATALDGIAAICAAHGFGS